MDIQLLPREAPFANACWLFSMVTAIIAIAGKNKEFKSIVQKIMKTTQQNYNTTIDLHKLYREIQLAFASYHSGLYKPPQLNAVWNMLDAFIPFCEYSYVKYLFEVSVIHIWVEKFDNKMSGVKIRKSEEKFAPLTVSNFFHLHQMFEPTGSYDCEHNYVVASNNLPEFIVVDFTTNISYADTSPIVIGCVEYELLVVGVLLGNPQTRIILHYNTYVLNTYDDKSPWILFNDSNISRVDKITDSPQTSINYVIYSKKNK